MVGRGLRPFVGKDDCIIIDLADNYMRHGLVSSIDTWTLDGAIEVAEMLKCCPSCGSVISRLETACPNCGHVFAGNRDGNGKNPRGQDVDLDLEEVIDGAIALRAARESQKEEAKSLYAGGMSVKDISERLRIGTGSLYIWAREGGWLRARQQEQIKRRQEAQRLVEGGMTFTEAGRKLGVSDSTICLWARAGGWERGVEPDKLKLKLKAQKLVEGGMNFSETARQLGVTPSTIREWAKDGGWERGVDTEQLKQISKKQEAQRLAKEGVNLPKVARQVGSGYSTIARWSKAGNWQPDPTPKP